MPDYLIQTPHNEQECLSALDEAVAKDNLSTFEFGCLKGNHTAYAIVRASTESEARSLVPQSIRHKAIVLEVQSITPDQVRQFHKAA